MKPQPEQVEPAASLQDVVPVVLAGGVGRRLWPLSRPRRPKPFLKFFGGASYLQRTVARVSGMRPPVLVCNKDHYELVQEQLKEQAIAPQHVFLEPQGRGTAAAATVAAHYLTAGNTKDALLLILPSDHAIARPEEFTAAVSEGIKHALDGLFVMIGVTPRRADPGFGYIRRGRELTDNIHEVERFIEKPDKTTAAGFLAEGDWLWNSGMFLFSARRFLSALMGLDGSLYESGRLAVARAIRRQNAIILNEEAFQACVPASLDRLVMEKTGQRVVVTADMGWQDIGSWPGLARSFRKS